MDELRSVLQDNSQRQRPRENLSMILRRDHPRQAVCLGHSKLVRLKVMRSKRS